jgi:hypothetical protein
VTLTFITLKEPIRITDPVNAVFTEYRVYQDIVLNVAKSTIDSVPKSGLTPEEFVLREVLQNAIDSEILRAGSLEKLRLEDFLWAYKKVKVQDIGNWKLVESKGTIDEDVFLYGYSTKQEITKDGCTLVGRFGVGLKESIFVLLYDRKHMFMAFNGHIYGFGYYYKDKVYYDLDSVNIEKEAINIHPVIFRGEYDIKDKILVYVPMTKESEIPLLYQYNKPYVLSDGDKGLVYHNGLYSGYWEIPLNINVCNLFTDQYRSYVYISGSLINSLNMIVDDEMPNAFKEIMLREVVTNEKLIIPNISEKLRTLFYNAEGKLRNVLQKALNMTVEKLAEMLNEKVIIVDKSNHIGSNQLPGISIPDIPNEYIINARTYLASKGYKTFSYSEVLNGELINFYNKIIEPNIPDKIKALIRLAEWLYSIGVNLMTAYGIPGFEERLFKIGFQYLPPLTPIPGIFDVDVKIVKPEYNNLLTDSVGITLKVGGKPLIVLKNLLAGSTEKQLLLYVGIMIHELNHVFSDFPHGTFQWENIYNVLYMVDVLDEYIAPFVANLMRLAVYNPQLFLNVNDITHLPPTVLPRLLIEKGECTGYIDYSTDKIRIICDKDASSKVKLENKNGTLYVVQVMEVEPE